MVDDLFRFGIFWLSSDHLYKVFFISENIYLPLSANPIPVVKHIVALFFISCPWVRLEAKSIGIPQNVEKTSMKTTFIRRWLKGVWSWKKFNKIEFQKNVCFLSLKPKYIERVIRICWMFAVGEFDMSCFVAISLHCNYPCFIKQASKIFSNILKENSPNWVMVENELPIKKGLIIC